MTTSPPRHIWITAAADGDPAPLPEPHLDIRCHRRLRGPYTGGGTLMRSIVPELLDLDLPTVAAHATEIVAVAPELSAIVPLPPQTLTNTAGYEERTRFYAAARTLRLAHGLTEVVRAWARLVHPGGVVIALRDLDDADPTDRELLRALIRRCDPAVVTFVVEIEDVADEALGKVLTAHTRRTAPTATPPGDLPADADPAQLYIDSDCTSRDPRLAKAYDDLAADDRARRHTARAEVLAARGEPTLRYGAIPYHLERGTDPAGAGIAAVNDAVMGCFDEGFYDAALDLCLRGRELFPDPGAHAEYPNQYWNFTTKVGASMSYLDRAEEAIGYFSEMRRCSTNPDVHMASNYGMAMIYTRHLPKADHDEDLALAWANGAIALADRHPDPAKRVFVGAFMRNARALVELHRGDLEGSLSLVNEGIRMTDADLGEDEQLLHRSVLLYNRAQILSALGDLAGGLADYDEVIRRDPDYGDYHFERAAKRRGLGMYAEALEDYAEAIRLSPPFREAHFNRADLLREVGDDEGALRDLDYAIDLEPDHIESLVNRTDLLLALGEVERATADIEHGLSLDPRNSQLLTARGAVLEELGDVEGAYASYTAAVTEDPDFAAAWGNRAILAYSAGRIAEAVADLDHAIRIADDVSLRANRAVALQDLGEYERALADLDIAVPALAAEDPDLLYRRGAVRHASGDVEGALADWRAHLAAFGPGETSPYAAEIKLAAGDLGATAEVPESVA